MLSKELAQSIVNKVMEVIPYNVNIMDEDGVIIGSGDSSRIGSLHEGALEALKNKKQLRFLKIMNTQKQVLIYRYFLEIKLWES